MQSKVIGVVAPLILASTLSVVNHNTMQTLMYVYTNLLWM
jgi:hypothetical protein